MGDPAIGPKSLIIWPHVWAIANPIASCSVGPSQPSSEFEGLSRKHCP